MALQADGSGDACAEALPLRSKLMAQAAIFAIHLFFIFYVHSKFPVAEAFSVVSKRFSNMFLYDPVAAAYFLFYGFAVYWTFALSTAAGVAFSTEACRDVAEGLIANGTLSTSVSFCYLVFMPGTLACALCCAWNSSSAPPPYSAGAPAGAARPGLMGMAAGMAAGAVTGAMGAGGSGRPTAHAYPAPAAKGQPMV
jgi:hypothetical protein